MKLKIEDIKEDIVSDEFRTYVKEELEETWKKEKEKVRDRVRHLKNKNSKRLSGKLTTKTPEMYKGIKVSDVLIGKPDVIPPKVKIHDDVCLNTEQRKALNVLPKDTFYSNITVKDADQQTEVCFAKMRLGDIKTDDQEEPKNIYDPITNTVDLSNKRATEMKSNIRVRLVEPDCNAEKEVKMDNLGVEIKKTYREFIDEYCTKKGEIKKEFRPNDQTDLKILDGVRDEVQNKNIMIVETDKTKYL